MNQYDITLGTGKRTVFADNHIKAFESLGYGKDYKITSTNKKSWQITLNGQVGHKRIYTINQL